MAGAGAVGKICLGGEENMFIFGGFVGYLLKICSMTFYDVLGFCGFLLYRFCLKVFVDIHDSLDFF